MKKNKLVKIAAWTGSVCTVLVAILFIHIYMVTHKPKADYDKRQLSRIDFKQPVDSAEANNIRAFVAGLHDVNSTYFNVPGGILIYSYTVGKQTSENVFKELMKHG